LSPTHRLADPLTDGQFAGQVIRLITRNKVLLYPDERPDYVLPERYRLAEKYRPEQSSSRNSNNNHNNNEDDDDNDHPSSGDRQWSIAHPRAERTSSGGVNAFHESHLAPGGDAEAHGRAPSEDSQATLVVEDSMLTRQGAQGIPQDKIRELMQDPNIVTWYGMSDEENPINWWVKGFLHLSLEA
jgi:DHA1 family multidrug resistance protein-like MFS transporter